MVRLYGLLCIVVLAERYESPARPEGRVQGVELGSKQTSREMKRKNVKREQERMYR